jgi:hypothetical protein
VGLAMLGQGQHNLINGRHVLSPSDVTIIPGVGVDVQTYFINFCSSGVGVTFLSHRPVCKPLKLKDEKWAKPI